MKGSLIIVGFFVFGLFLSRLGINLVLFEQGTLGLYVLYVLMFLVGLSIGSDKKALAAIRRSDWRMFLLPLGTIVGTLAGVALISPLVFDRSLTDCLAVGSGFGYYSLSAIFITEYKGVELGTVALTSNIIREIITLLAAPLLVRYFGKLAPISAGGATTMDTTLPIITHVSGAEFAVLAILHGIVVDFTVPFLVTFFCSI